MLGNPYKESRDIFTVLKCTVQRDAVTNTGQMGVIYLCRNILNLVVVYVKEVMIIL